MDEGQIAKCVDAESDAGAVESTGPAGDDRDVGPLLTASPSRRRRNPWVEWLVVISVAVGAALLVRAFVLQQFAVSGYSMINTLHDGDRVLVNKLSYRLHDPRRGDVVVLKTIDGASERDLIKRVVGLPTETVEYRSCVLYINGRKIDEPYLSPLDCRQARRLCPRERRLALGRARN